ncbi:MAG TPA: hypothetical protein VMU48_06600 [Terracidiphilus sp.]|nr:hypothetical protein [Terracidiphilus sp.]
MRVNVEQLEQMLKAASTRSDSQIAEQLSGLELTERLSEVRLARLEASLPGSRSRKRLTLLADASAFMDLPPSDCPDTSAPDYAKQVFLLGLARNYVANTILKLPNFFATRNTTNYVSTLADIRINSVNTIPYKPFEEVDASNVTVLYRDGHEMAARGEKYRASSKEVRTRGEFGPILVVVLDDVSKGKVAWSHWEQGAAGLLAVFQYAVPRSASHYLVTSPGLNQEQRYYPAYHGEIALNPANGSILRLTVVPEMNAGDPMTSADLMVDYAPVEIGGVNYICPVKSVALSQVRVVNRELDDQWDLTRSFLGPPQIFLNEVVFTRYHLFRSESRILTGESQKEAVEHTAQDQPVFASVQPSSSIQAKPSDFGETSETLPSGGSLRFSVEDLEQGLSRDKTNGSSDAEIAQHLSKIQLTERLSGAPLASIEAELSSPVDRVALEALVDESAFLDLPAADIPAQPAPDKASQAVMLARALDYVQKTFPHMPNFSAVQKITCFADTPAGKKTSYEPLHKVSDFSKAILYVGGHESIEEGKKKKISACDFSDMGEFGPILATVLTEATENGVDWSHWELGETGLQAVFSYAIPQNSSHYPFSSKLSQLSRRSMASVGVQNTQDNPAYHGEVFLNPADGSILRITVVADMKPDAAVKVADVSVEYLPIEMGGKKYLCPKKSVALYRMQSADHQTRSTDGQFDAAPSSLAQMYLSEVLFMKYRLDR